MAILIPNVEFPKACIDCPLNYDMYYCTVREKVHDWNKFTDERHPECPLIEVADEVEEDHSEDGLCRSCRYYYPMNGNSFCFCPEYSDDGFNIDNEGRCSLWKPKRKER